MATKKTTRKKTAAARGKKPAAGTAKKTKKAARKKTAKETAPAKTAGKAPARSAAKKTADRSTVRPGEGETPKPKTFICPHCNRKMNKWQVPPFQFSDGLGWGTDHLYICFNDQCGFFTRSWGHMEEVYGQEMGYRCMCHPDSGEFMAIPAGSVDAMKGNIIDEIQEAKDAAALERRKLSMGRLTDAYMAKSLEGILAVLVEETEWPSVQLKAVQMIGDMKDLRAIEPLMNIQPANEVIREAMKKAVRQIHEANYTRECPHCAEIIKQRAKICKHCGLEV